MRVRGYSAVASRAQVRSVMATSAQLHVHVVVLGNSPVTSQAEGMSLHDVIGALHMRVLGDIAVMFRLHIQL